MHEQQALQPQLQQQQQRQFPVPSPAFLSSLLALLIQRNLNDFRQAVFSFQQRNFHGISSQQQQPQRSNNHGGESNAAANSSRSSQPSTTRSGNGNGADGAGGDVEQTAVLLHDREGLIKGHEEGVSLEESTSLGEQRENDFPVVQGQGQRQEIIPQQSSPLDDQLLQLYNDLHSLCNEWWFDSWTHLENVSRLPIRKLSSFQQVESVSLLPILHEINDQLDALTFSWRHFYTQTRIRGVFGDGNIPFSKVRSGLYFAPTPEQGGMEAEERMEEDTEMLASSSASASVSVKLGGVPLLPSSEYTPSQLVAWLNAISHLPEEGGEARWILQEAVEEGGDVMIRVPPLPPVNRLAPPTLLSQAGTLSSSSSKQPYMDSFLLPSTRRQVVKNEPSTSSGKKEGGVGDGKEVFDLIKTLTDGSMSIGGSFL